MTHADRARAAVPHGGRARAAVAGGERRGAAAPAARPGVRRRRRDARSRSCSWTRDAGDGARVRARRRSRSSRSSGRRRSRCGPGAAPTSTGWFASFGRHRARQPAALRRVRRAHRRDLHRGRARRRPGRSARSRRCGSGAGESVVVGGYTVTFVGHAHVEHRPEDVASRPTSRCSKGGRDLGTYAPAVSTFPNSTLGDRHAVGAHRAPRGRLPHDRLVAERAGPDHRRHRGQLDDALDLDRRRADGARHDRRDRPDACAAGSASGAGAPAADRRRPSRSARQRRRSSEEVGV